MTLCAFCMMQALNKFRRPCSVDGLLHCHTGKKVQCNLSFVGVALLSLWPQLKDSSLFNEMLECKMVIC